MTEYTTSSQAIREYMSSRERTAYWVQSHSPDETEFYSPSVPPTELDDYVPSSPPSEAGSSHSVPPRMVLRYNAGRADVPIPRPALLGMTPAGLTKLRDGSFPRSQPITYGSHHRSRAGSHGSSPLSGRNSRHHERSPPRAPEEIRILPSHGEIPRAASSRHPRSKSLPRTSELQSVMEGEVPFVPPPLPMSPPPPNHTRHGSLPGQQFAPSHPHHTWNPNTGRMHNPRHIPPAIIYAPAQHSRTHYTPPPMYHHPPQMGPNGMIYSHSAPVASSYHPMNARPYAPGMSSSGVGSSTVHEENYSGRRGGENRNRSQSLSGPGAPINPTASTTSLGSNESGSTYYVLPAAGQKVHIITPSPEQSIVTATSTTKSPISPKYGNLRKPFLQRLFSFAGKFSSAGSSKGSSMPGRRLQRRHSTGGAARQIIEE